jgi:hypothetical protein
MGKTDFADIYCAAKRALGGTPSVKISAYSDAFEDGADFAGLILYHKNDSFAWRHTDGKAAGHRARTFYVIIQRTDKWPKSAFKRAGEGKVHDYLFKNLTGEEYRDKTACCGGFALLPARGEGTVYSSVWLNMSESPAGYSNSWGSDGSKQMCEEEQQVVDFSVKQWKAGGPNTLHRVPGWLDSWLTSRATAGNLSAPSNWVRHTYGSRAFYRQRGDDTSVTLDAPAEGVAEEKADGERWFEERWRALAASARHIAAASNNANKPSRIRWIEGRKLRRVELSELSYRGGWNCDVCCMSQGHSSPLYHDAPRDGEAGGFDVCLGCAAPVIAGRSPPRAPAVAAGGFIRPTVGDRVRLARDVGRSGSEGCLLPGEVGVIVEDDHDSTPYKVRAPDGTTYWYSSASVTRASGGGGGGGVIASTKAKEQMLQMLLGSDEDSLFDELAESDGRPNMASLLAHLLSSD